MSALGVIRHILSSFRSSNCSDCRRGFERRLGSRDTLDAEPNVSDVLRDTARDRAGRHDGTGGTAVREYQPFTPIIETLRGLLTGEPSASKAITARTAAAITISTPRANRQTTLPRWVRWTESGSPNRLVISEGTVKSHVKHILRKLRAANRAEAVSRYMRLLNPRLGSGG